MSKKSIRDAAKLLGRLSGLKRGSPPDKALLRMSKKQKHLAAVALGTLGKPGGKAYTLEEAQTDGRKGGLIGGPARAAALSAKRRRAIAKKAAKARWKAHKKEVEFR